ncbi:hypothetical protein UFOVP1511_19 [uncultured Caudovirales phage]|uniref:Holin n=1 Tax=uncultured Caudovirales phage TaxID=2100421 RepID=A0A6J7X7T1_9CAUD|nr:hypothetical protein UFOVP1280_19 [uncultured Caudovirales phage]CAB5226741.1 hypothetical protein UFOVP1511_19 [uncultured Caudovirales phage]
MRKYTNSEIKARLILVVGITLAATFVLSTASLLYGLLFVVQPLEVSPNDSDAWDLLKPMMLFLTGSMTGILSANGLKDKDKDND